MSPIHIILLALVQGVTEFLPVSSSGHLILLPLVTGWQDQGILIDVAAHVGTFFAVLVYFRRDVREVLHEAMACLSKKEWPRHMVLLGVATLPALLAGAFLKPYLSTAGRSAIVIGWASLIFGFLMAVVDRRSPHRKTYVDMKPIHALLIGMAQAFAIVPGSSRSGTTVTMARFLGFQRDDAFRFSFLLSLPVIAGAAILTFGEALKAHAFVLQWETVLTILLSFLFGYGAVIFIMGWVKKMSLAPFGVYRVVLGVILLLYGYGFL